jgi:hypothetical protein
MTIDLFSEFPTEVEKTPPSSVEEGMQMWWADNMVVVMM